MSNNETEAPRDDAGRPQAVDRVDVTKPRPELSDPLVYRTKRPAAAPDADADEPADEEQTPTA